MASAAMIGGDVSFGADERELLRRITSKYSPEILGMVDAVGIRPLTEKEREALRAGLAEEFVSVGLKEDSEPNEYDLIGRLMFF